MSNLMRWDTKHEKNRGIYIPLAPKPQRGDIKQRRVNPTKADIPTMQAPTGRHSIA